MWEMILNISKDNQYYAKVSLGTDHRIAIALAQDFAIRFPASEGFTLSLLRFYQMGESVDFTAKS